MEIIGYPYVIWSILVFVATFVLGSLVIGVGVVRVGQCLWGKLSGRGNFSGCLFSTPDQHDT